MLISDNTVIIQLFATAITPVNAIIINELLILCYRKMKKLLKPSSKQSGLLRNICYQHLHHCHHYRVIIFIYIMCLLYAILPLLNSDNFLKIIDSKAASAKD